MAELTIAQKLEAAQTKLNELTATVATLTTERDTARTEKAQAIEAAVAPLNSTIATLTKERDQAKTDLGTAQASLVTKDGEIAELKKNDKTSGQKALQIAAGQNTAPVGEDAQKKTTVAKTYGELVAEHRATTDPKERAEIWRQIEALNGKAK